MLESERAGALNRALLLQNIQIRAHSNSTQSEHGGRPDQLQFPFEIRLAIRQFRWKRLVRGWRAPDRGRNVSIVECQPIVAADGSWLVREARAVQGFVEEISRAISREHPARAVGAVRGRSESQDQKGSMRIAEGWHRLAPIIPVPKGWALHASNGFPIFHKPGAQAAADNFLVQLCKCRGHGHIESYHESRECPRAVRLAAN